MLQTVRDLAPYLRPHRWKLVAGLVLIVVNGFFATLAPIIPGRAIDEFRNQTMTMGRLWLYVAAIVGVMAVAAVATWTGADWLAVVPVPNCP